MICISISQESRWFALVDMYNARSQCDLLEVRLDRFVTEADIGELLASRPKPVIMTCRRAEDGGDWSGMEQERQALLKHCFACKADYVEVELDVADQFPPAPPSKRVIAYTNYLETPSNLAELYAEALTKQPDVVKLVVPARSPEEVWPVLQILAKPPVPTVVVGLGQPGVMLAVLARKMGAPWAYAALERGMEAYFGQPTVRDLETVYHYREIEKGTRLAGVTDAGELQFLTVALLNAALAGLGQPLRCLPLEIGDLNFFRKVLDALKLNFVAVGAQHRGPLRALAAEQDSMAKAAESVDFLVRKDGKWQGLNLLSRAALAALERTLRASAPGDNSIKGRAVLLAGTGGLVQALGQRIQQAGGKPLLTSEDEYEARSLAEKRGWTFVPSEEIEKTSYDILLVGEETGGARGLEPGHLKKGATVLDLTSLPRKSTFLRAAETAGCHVVAPGQVLLEQVMRQAKTIAGQEVPREPLVKVLNELLED